MNGKQFYKSYVNWEDVNQTQRNETISFWVSNLKDEVRFTLKNLVEADVANEAAEEANKTSIMNSMIRHAFCSFELIPLLLPCGVMHYMKKNRMQLVDHDGQGGTCPFDSLASLFNDPTNKYKNACIIPDRTDESGCYIPEPGM